MGGFVAVIPLRGTTLVDFMRFFTLEILLVVAGEVVAGSLVGAASYFVVADAFVFAALLVPQPLFWPQPLGFRKLVLPRDQFALSRPVWGQLARSTSRPMLAS